MLLRTTIFALALGMAVPMAAQAQTIDFGAGGPQIDLRSKKQRMKDNFRDQQARDQYRRDAYRADRADRYRYRDRDRDIPTGSVRRYNEGYDYDRRRGNW